MTRAFLLCLILLALPLAAQAGTEVRKVTSSRGITAWLREDQSLPIVSIAFAWRGGFERDPENRQGLGALATAMLTRGAGPWDDNAYQKELQENVIGISFGSARDQVSGRLKSLKETLPLATRLLAAAVNEPRFGPEALARQKARQQSALKFRLSDPEWLLARLAMREVFAGHPYGLRAQGTARSIAAVTAEDLRHWHARHLARGNLLVTASGAISAAGLSRLLDQVFGALPENPPPASVPDAAFEIGGKNFLLKKPGPQAEMLLIWPGLPRASPDWHAGEVMNYILGGGGFSSRLMKEIRVKRGLTYGVSTGFSPLDHAALFLLQVSARGKDAGRVLRLARDEIRKLAATPPDGDELQAAKDDLIGSYPLALTSTSAIAGHDLRLRLDDLSPDEEERRAQAIRAVTAEQVRDLAKRLLSRPPALFMVGEPEGVTPGEIFTEID